MRTLRKVSLGVVAGVALLLTGVVMAQDKASRVKVDIEPQPIMAALEKFADQTGLQIVFRNEMPIEGWMAPRIVGELTPTEALSQLLGHTRFQYEFVNERTVRIMAAPASGGNAGQASAIRVAEGEEQKTGAPGSEEVKLEEVVVTAQKRKERLQDVPISISVLKGQDLDRFTGLGVSEALEQVPGVKMTQEGGLATGNTQLGIRGVAAAGATFNGSSPIGYYMDSVPFGLVKSAILPDTSTYDLSQVEVLRGPQGTLYGASALNGVVRILTHDPDLNDFEAKARASTSTTQDGGGNYRVDAAANVPLIPGKLAARAVLGYRDYSGWIDKSYKKNTNDEQVSNARLKLSAQLTDKLSMGLMGWRSRSDFGAPPVADNEGHRPGLADAPSKTDFDVAGWKVGYDFSRFSLSSMTSYIDYTSNNIVDFTAYGFSAPGGGGIEIDAPTSFFTQFDSKVFAQEINLTSTGAGSWRWSTGGFYRDAKDRLFQDGSRSLLPAAIDLTDKSQSFAAFGELTRLFIGGRLSLTGGLRYFQDKVTQIENSSFCGPTCPGHVLIRDSDTFDKVSPRAVLTWHQSNDSTLYASYSEGFRSGFNQNATIIEVSPGFPPVRPDRLRNYEVGTKGSSSSGLVSYEAAAYFIDWQEVQQSLWVAVPGSNGGAVVIAVVNGESASGAGADFGVTLRPVRGLRLGGSFSWNDLGLDKAVELRGITLFQKGDRLNYSSKYTAGAFASYDFPLGGNGLEAQIEASANYSSKITQRTLVSTLSVNTGDNILTARTNLSIGRPDRWTVALFADNVTNERATPVRAVPEFEDSRLRPRTVGLQYEYKFNNAK